MTNTAVNPTPVAESNAATEARLQTAMSTAHGAPRDRRGSRRILSFPGSLPPARAALLRIEVRLQDELRDTQLAICDAAERGLPSPFAWPAGRLCWIRTKIRLFGFRPPRPANLARLAPADRPAERLHLRWTTLLETLLRSQRPSRCICPGSFGADSMRAPRARKEENR
jgi:hypothetical protein